MTISTLVSASIADYSQILIDFKFMGNYHIIQTPAFASCTFPVNETRSANLKTSSNERRKNLQKPVPSEATSFQLCFSLRPPEPVRKSLNFPQIIIPALGLSSLA